MGKLVGLCEISLDKLSAIDDRLRMAFREIVVDHNRVAVADQLLGYYTSDIAGAAGHKYAHKKQDY